MTQIDQMTVLDEQFDVVEALYQEAENMRPRTPSGQNISLNTGEKRPVIQSFAPPKPASSAPKTALAPAGIIDRIEDLYLEAEAMREGEPTVLAPLVSPDVTADITASDPNEEQADDDFGIPSEFGEFDSPSSAHDTPSEADQEADLENRADMTDDDSALIAALASSDNEEQDSAETDSFAIPETFEAAETADKPDNLITSETVPETLDVNEPFPELPELPDLPELDMPAAAENAAGDTIMASNEAPDDAKDASPEDSAADTDITRQLDDVRQAVEEAQDSLAPADQADQDTPTATAQSDETTSSQPAPDKDESAQPPTDSNLLTPGPELAQFIGETVRDVLDTELPVMVRGLVNEALSERGGRYGNLAGSQIGLRTKSTKEFF